MKNKEFTIKLLSKVDDNVIDLMNGLVLKKLYKEFEYSLGKLDDNTFRLENGLFFNDRDIFMSLSNNKGTEIKLRIEYNILKIHLSIDSFIEYKTLKEILSILTDKLTSISFINLSEFMVLIQTIDSIEYVPYKHTYKVKYIAIVENEVCFILENISGGRIRLSDFIGKLKTGEIEIANTLDSIDATDRYLNKEDSKD